jgi:hypothetical protein
MQTVSNSKCPRIIAQTKRISVRNFFGFEHGIVPYQTDSKSVKLLSVVLPGKKNEYLRLPMGLYSSPDIFQEKMSELMQGLKFAQAYIDHLLIITTGTSTIIWKILKKY